MTSTLFFQSRNWFQHFNLHVRYGFWNKFLIVASWTISFLVTVIIVPVVSFLLAFGCWICYPVCFANCCKMMLFLALKEFLAICRAILDVCVLTAVTTISTLLCHLIFITWIMIFVVQLSFLRLTYPCNLSVLWFLHILNLKCYIFCLSCF